MNIKEIMSEISQQGLTDKSLYHSYDEVYPQIFEKFLGRKLNILEIGTGKGGGLLMFSRVFPESNIFGLDHNYSILEIDTENYKIKLLKECDQCDVSFIKELPFLDIVLEDASHEYTKSIKTFENLEPKLNPGAVYIIEDVYPQFLKSYSDDERFEVFDLRHLKNRGDDIVAVYEKGGAI